LRGLARQVVELGQPVAAATWVDERRPVRPRPARVCRLAGRDRRRAEGQGLAPLACKTDRIDAWVLAELSRRDLVPEIWLPTPGVRAERERARLRLHLVRHRTALKNRVHATLLAFGKPCVASDLFGAGGRRLLDQLQAPPPWAGTLAAAVQLIDDLDERVAGCERELRRLAPTIPTSHG
jgi:transposase